MARDGATGSEQDEHPADLVDDTGPTREDVKSSEEGATPCQTLRPDTGEETFLPLRVYFPATPFA